MGNAARPWVPAPCGGSTGIAQRKTANAPRMPAVPAPCGGSTGIAQRKAANAPQMPAVPAPCGGNTGIVQRKAATAPRMSAVSAPSGGSPGILQRKATNRAPQRTVQRLRKTGSVPGGGRAMLFHIEDNAGRTVLDGALLGKVTTALTNAKTRLQTAINALGGVLTADQLGAMRYCFGANQAAFPGVVATVLEKLQQTYDGLHVDGLVLKDESQANIDDHNAEGHVDAFIGIRIGPIHTRFDLALEALTFNIIHEATHLFAGTIDVKPGGYCRGSYAGWMAGGRAAGLLDTQPLVLKAGGINNADSYAICAYALSGLAMP